jgi:hypothetical protein
MKRFTWDILFALLLGFGLGLAYAWVISPQQFAEAAPATLRSDFKDQFRAAIAASYAASGNLPRAQARLDLLGEDDHRESLNAQAQRDIANGQFQQADQLAALAIALDTGVNILPQSAPTVKIFEPPDVEPSITPLSSPEDVPFVVTETLETVQPFTPQPNPNTAAPLPTRTALPTQGTPFQLTALDTVCDANLSDNLLQVIVYNSNRRQLAGIKIIVTWESGEEQFFTGLKPELGNGYADFSMQPDTTYSVQLELGSEIATNLTSPACRAPGGEAFNGGLKLTFQQP